SATIGRTNDARALASALLESASERRAFQMAAAQSVAYLLSAGEIGEALVARLPSTFRDDDVDPLLSARIAIAPAVRAEADGDPAGVRANVMRAAAAFERAGDRKSARAARANVGYASTELGLHEEAETILVAAIDEARTAGASGTVAWA